MMNLCDSNCMLYFLLVPWFASPFFLNLSDFVWMLIPLIIVVITLLAFLWLVNVRYFLLTSIIFHVIIYMILIVRISAILAIVHTLFDASFYYDSYLVYDTLILHLWHNVVLIVILCYLTYYDILLIMNLYQFLWLHLYSFF